MKSKTNMFILSSILVVSACGPSEIQFPFGPSSSSASSRNTSANARTTTHVVDAGETVSSPLGDCPLMDTARHLQGPSYPSPRGFACSKTNTSSEQLDVSLFLEKNDYRSSSARLCVLPLSESSTGDLEPTHADQAFLCNRPGQLDEWSTLQLANFPIGAKSMLVFEERFASTVRECLTQGTLSAGLCGDSVLDLVQIAPRRIE